MRKRRNDDPDAGRKPLVPRLYKTVGSTPTAQIKPLRGTTSSAQNVTFKNASPATNALGIASIAISGNFKISSNTCKSSLPAGSQCIVGVEFKPAVKGTRNGSLTIKDFNLNSPHVVSLTGTGS